MIREIVIYGDPILRTKGRRVTQVNDDIRQLAADMLETMQDAGGVGLAAQQVGEALQLTVIDVSHAEKSTEPDVDQWRGSRPQRSHAAGVTPSGAEVKSRDGDWPRGLLEFPRSEC